MQPIVAGIVLLLIPTTTSILIDDNCIAFSEKEVYVHGTHMNISYWNPGLFAEKEHYLRLDIFYHGKKFPEDFSILYVFTSEIRLIKYRNEKPSTLANHINPPLPAGWTLLQLAFGTHIRVLPNSLPGTVLNEENDFQVEKVRIFASNATVNCPKDMKTWMVSRENAQVIPLRDLSQNFIIYSKDAVKPVISVDEKDFPMGWDGKEYTNGSDVGPLPPYKEHIIALQCNVTHSKFRDCSLMMGDRTIIPVRCGRPDCFITMASQSGSFSVVLQRIIPRVAEDLAEPLTESSSVTSTVIVLVFFVVALLVILGLATKVYILSQKKLKSRLTDIEAHMELLPAKTGMWHAVKTNDVRFVRYLLRSGIKPDAEEEGTPTTPWLEAHILGRSQIVKAFLKHLGEESKPPSNALVKQVMEILVTRINEVFKAAKCGLYDKQEGVREKLRSSDLPPTIRDENGWSIIHHIADSKLDDDGRPAWEANDIQGFFENEEPLANAIDQWGQTALHVLANREKGKEEAKVVWDGEDCTVAEAWLGVAKILMENGCDPRIKDHRGQLAQEVAKEKGHHKLVDLLKKKCTSLGEIDRAAARKRFPELVQATKDGKIDMMKELLMDNVPTLPMTAEEDPLDEALRHGHRDAVFLLLNAGAPLCNQYSVTLSPLEFSHHMVGQPAFFPALIRKAYMDRIDAEEKRAQGSSFLSSSLKQLKTQIAEKGDRVQWLCKGDPVKRTTEAKKILLEAAPLGLSLTCQMLSQEDVCLHSIKGEANALELALNAKQYDTAYQLCRDLWMTPFTSNSDSCVPSELTDDLKERDLMIFKRICNNKEIIYGKTICDEIYDRVSNAGNLVDENLDLTLHWIAENGLVTLLHAMEQQGIDINRQISKFSKSTVLHIAALCGHTNIVGYLHNRGAKFENTIGDFEVKDHAAISKRKGCLVYMCLLDKDKDPKASLMEYGIMEKRYEVANVEPKYIEYSREDALSALSEPSSHGYAYEMLKKRGKKLQIKSFSDLQNTAEEMIAGDALKIYIDKFKEKIDFLSTLINQTDPSLYGAMEMCGPIADGYEVMSFDTVNVTLEINNLFGESSITTEQYRSTYVESTTRKKFKKSFMSLMESIVANSDLLERNQLLSLVPPFLMPNDTGVFLYWIWKEEFLGEQDQNFTMKRRFSKSPQNKAIRLFRMHIVPVLQLTASDFQSSFFQKRGITASPAGNNQVLALLYSVEENYFFTSYTVTRRLMENLSREQRKVLYMCRFIAKLTTSRYSYHRIRTENLTPAWKRTSDQNELRARVIEFLFLEDLKEAEPSESRIADVHEKVLSVLRRATTKDECGRLIGKNEIVLIYNSSHRVPLTSQSVIGIIKYLENLPKYSAKLKRLSAYSISSTSSLKRK